MILPGSHVDQRAVCDPEKEIPNVALIPFAYTLFDRFFELKHTPH